MKHINKYFLQFFSVYKNDKIIIKTQRIRLKKSKWNILKSFRRRKWQKSKKAWESYQNLAEEERKYKHTKNPFEEKKQKLVEYRRNYHLTHND